MSAHTNSDGWFSSLVRFFKQALGWLVTVVSLPFVVMAIGDLITGDNAKTGTGVLAGLAVFFSGTTLGGILLIRSGRKRRLADRNLVEERESQVLRIATESQGTLGPSLLAAKTGWSFAECQQVLDHLVQHGACELVVTDGGAIFYRFPDLMASEEERTKARGLLQH